MSTIWIIGNANETKTICHLIKSEDIIIRFNNPNETCSLKPTILFMSTAYSFLEYLFMHSEKVNWSAILSAKKIVYRWPIRSILTNKPEYLSFSQRLKFPFYLYRLSKMRKFSKNTFFYPHSEFVRCQQELQTSTQPSSGILAILWCFINHPNHKIYIHNFTFEGWEGHDWKNEEKYVRRLHDLGKLTIV